MFAAAFSASFAGAAASAFASCFAAPFHQAGPLVDYIGPVMAQAALVAGGAVEIDGGCLKVNGKVLIGPAGKVYEFSSDITAATWAENTLSAGAAELDIYAAMPADRRSAWRDGKRQKLAVIAGRVVDAAARTADIQKQKALIKEADFCLTKWS
jgi:hypothetical protein